MSIFDRYGREFLSVLLIITGIVLSVRAIKIDCARGSFKRLLIKIRHHVRVLTALERRKIFIFGLEEFLLAVLHYFGFFVVDFRNGHVFGEFSGTAAVMPQVDGLGDLIFVGIRFLISWRNPVTFFVMIDWLYLWGLLCSIKIEVIE